MAIIFVAASLLGVIAFLALGMLFHENLAWSRTTAYVTAASIVLSGLAYSAARMVREPWYTERPESPRLFHLFQVAAVGTCFGVAFLMSKATSDLRWVGFVFEVIVGCFYLAYIGFGYALRHPPSSSVFIGFLCVIVSAIYGFWTASRWPNHRVERTATKRLVFDAIGSIKIDPESPSARPVSVAHSGR